MADNFGSQQNRVLDVKDRNLDNVVFQYRHPPLTSEWNLINQIGNEKIQSLSKMSLPSGWLHVDDILQNISETSARTGSVICSESYAATTFKMMSFDNNYAIVNGWPVLVQGWGLGGTLNENVIRLDETDNQYNNFVFLEVWRKLAGSPDPIYRYGNIDRPYSDNEIEWETIGCETTKRVQIQYRIRCERVSSLTDCTEEIFDNNSINPIGGRTTKAVLQSFSKFGPSDPGLYVAGDGSDEQKEYLGTVDGYVYAIPMFVVYRRNLYETGFSPTTMNRTAVNKASTFRSDRPDNKIADIIYKDDIIDLRHQVMVSNDVKSAVDITISKLLSGDLTTALKKPFAENGAVSNSYSGASTLMKVERLNSPSGDNIPDVGVGSNTASTDFKRRVFCNAEITSKHNVVQIQNSGSWVAGTFTIASKVTLPAGTVVTAPKFFSKLQGAVTGVTSDGVSITIASGSSLIGTSNDLWMDYQFTYESSSSGFKDVPKNFVEINKNQTLAIATKDNDVFLKYNNSGELLNFSASSGEVGYPGDISQTDRVHYCGANYTDSVDIGHELILTRTAVSGIVTLTLNNYKYNKYFILGVKAVSVDSELESFNVSLTTSACIITIPTILSTPSKSVEIRLYTGSGFNAYTIEDSFKFFELSKQGKGIIDTYEMIMVSATSMTGTYVIDTGDKPIIKIGTTLSEVGGYVTGTPFYFNSSGDMRPLSSSYNDILPVLEDYSGAKLPTRIDIAIATTGAIKVPVLVHSYVTVNEAPYNFYYDTVPYQGLLNTTSSSIYGKIVQEGPALITTSGSGSIVDFTYNEGTVNFTYGVRTITGIGTLWQSYVLPGDYIRKADSSYFYRVLEVTSDTSLIISEVYRGITEGDVDYEIVRFDISDSVNSNVVDRLPAYSVESTTDITDYTCYSDGISMTTGNNDTIMTSAQGKLQDPLCAYANDFRLGDQVAKRGRCDLRMSISGNPVFKVGNSRPYLIYPDVLGLTEAGHNKKVYQFYVFMRSGKDYHANADLMGRIYLMVVAGETADDTRNYLNPFSNKDVVDIFELVGRPIIRG